MKATYGEIKVEPYDGMKSRHIVTENDNYYVESREIFKDPITDDGTKKSKKGLLRVIEDNTGILMCKDQQIWAEEQTGLLTTVFKDSKLIKTTTLEEIRQRLNN
jgi:nicotinamide phosphoribosyltransferase